MQKNPHCAKEQYTQKYEYKNQIHIGQRADKCIFVTKMTLRVWYFYANFSFVNWCEDGLRLKLQLKENLK